LAAIFLYLLLAMRHLPYHPRIETEAKKIGIDTTTGH
jgi:hypothetical protein